MTPKQRAAQRVANSYAKVCNKRFNIDIPVPVPMDFDLCTRGTKKQAESAGEARSEFGQLSISINDILLTEFESHIYNHTIPHEIAHLVVFVKFHHKGADVSGHGVEWQEVMRVLGLNPDKYHKLDCTKAISHYRVEKRKAKALAKANK